MEKEEEQEGDAMMNKILQPLSKGSDVLDAIRFGSICRSNRFSRFDSLSTARIHDFAARVFFDRFPKPYVAKFCQFAQFQELT